VPVKRTAWRLAAFDPSTAPGRQMRGLASAERRSILVAMSTRNIAILALVIVVVVVIVLFVL
jgi:hypothetical protein